MTTLVYLITGFLGAGKTSFLKHLLEKSPAKVGVLVNEFGKVSVDGPILHKADLNLVELNNGSIFCSCLKDSFISALRTLIEQDLAAIYIESSGLADPSSMTQIIDLIRTQTQAKFDYEGSICLIDGLYFEQELKKMLSVERQIKHSQAVIINKIDLIDEAKYQLICEKIRELNPIVPIYKSSFGEIDLEQLQLSTKPDLGEETTNREDNRPYIVVMQLKEQVEMDKIQQMVGELKDSFYRIKGIVRQGDQLFTVDTVQDRLDVAAFPLPEAISVDSTKTDQEQMLVFISAVGISGLSKIINAADKWIPGEYDLQG